MCGKKDKEVNSFEGHDIALKASSGGVLIKSRKWSGNRVPDCKRDGGQIPSCKRETCTQNYQGIYTRVSQSSIISNSKKGNLKV